MSDVHGVVKNQGYLLSNVRSETRLYSDRVAEPFLTPTLTASSAMSIAATTAHHLRWDATDARLLGPIAENATVLLPYHQVVLRISAAAHHGRAVRELRLARWLREHGIPVIRPVGIEQPLQPVWGGRSWVVSVWDEIREPRPAPAGVIGEVLRRLHRLDAPSAVDLPVLDPFEGVDGYLGEACLEPHEILFLRQRLDLLRDSYTRLDFVRAPGPVHGDAHRKNIVQDAHGRPVLLDLERFSIGAREWDLVVAAVYRRVGWYSEAEYDDFVDAYGWDVQTWTSGFETLAAARELRMTAWLCARLDREPHLRPEAQRRIASLKDPATPRDWTPGT